MEKTVKGKNYAKLRVQFQMPVKGLMYLSTYPKQTPNEAKGNERTKEKSSENTYINNNDEGFSTVAVKSEYGYHLIVEPHY